MKNQERNGEPCPMCGCPNSGLGPNKGRLSWDEIASNYRRGMLRTLEENAIRGVWPFDFNETEHIAETQSVVSGGETGVDD